MVKSKETIQSGNWKRYKKVIVYNIFEYAFGDGIDCIRRRCVFNACDDNTKCFLCHKNRGFDCGIMTPTSHNPYYDNGIKLLNSKGEKMEDDNHSIN